MKIAHVMTTNAFAGSERIVELLAREQAAQGHQVFVCLPDICPLRTRLQTASDISMTRIPALGHAWRYLMGLEAKIRRFDIVHIHDVRAARMGAFAANRFKINVVFHAHIYTFLDEFGVLSKRGRIVAVSRDMRDRLKADPRVYKDGIVHVPNGITDPVKTSSNQARKTLRELIGVSPNAKVFLFPSRLRADKGFEHLLSPPDFAGDHYHICVCTARADGEIGEMLIDRMKRGGNPIFHNLGFREDVIELMCGADGVLVPSVNEPFGLVAAEALAQGVPVFMSDAGGLADIAEVAEDAAVVVPVCELDRFRETLENSLSQLDALHESARRKMKVIQDTFSSTLMAERVEAVYRELLNSR